MRGRRILKRPLGQFKADGCPAAVLILAFSLLRNASRSEGILPSMGFSAVCAVHFEGKMPSLRQNETGWVPNAKRKLHPLRRPESPGAASTTLSVQRPFGLSP